MTLQQHIDQSYAAFFKYSRHTQIILLHPDSQYRSVLVAKLINDPAHQVLYYALGPDDQTLPSLIAGMIHDLANQHPAFGRHINMLPPNVFDNSSQLEQVVQAFAQDIAEITPDNLYLILDEYDRSDISDDVQCFVEQLVHYLSSNCKLVINSRTLPRLPWVSLVAKNKATLIKDDTLITDNFYELNTTGSNTLEIYALGPGFVLMNDKPIDTWEGHLPRLLFFFTLDRPVVTRSEICQSFWPELDTDQAVNVFHVTKRRLHKALDMDILVHVDGYYRVNPDLGIKYDVMNFVATLMEGRNEDLDIKTRMKAWGRAVEIYTGPFLQGHTDPWITARRLDYQSGYLEALTSMANVRLDEGRKEQSLALFQKVLVEDNTRLDIHRRVMRLFASMGRRSEAAAHYQSISDELDLDDETHAVYADIMS